MRKVNIDSQTPPQSWIDEAEIITQKLLNAQTKEERESIIESNQNFWRRDDIRTWLKGLFNNKCWYTEAHESVSPLHVDHFRPKGRITELDKSTCEGYWWLSFIWKNYRMSGSLINSKKNDYFPLIDNRRATKDEIHNLDEIENYYFIDPITDDTSFISFEKIDDGCIAVASADIDDEEKKRFEITRDYFGLNRLNTLNQKRLEYWDSCMQEIIKYKSATGPSSIKKVKKASSTDALKKMVDYNAEFSSVCRACIRKYASEPVIDVVLKTL